MLEHFSDVPGKSVLDSSQAVCVSKVVDKLRVNACVVIDLGLDVLYKHVKLLLG